jgi:hypothetical protein
LARLGLARLCFADPTALEIVWKAVPVVSTSLEMDGVHRYEVRSTVLRTDCTVESRRTMSGRESLALLTVWGLAEARTPIELSDKLRLTVLGPYPSVFQQESNLVPEAYYGIRVVISVDTDPVRTSMPQPSLEQAVGQRHGIGTGKCL